MGCDWQLGTGLNKQPLCLDKPQQTKHPLGPGSPMSLLNVISCSNELHALSFRLTLSLEEKELSLRTLEENSLAQHNEVSQLLSALHQAQQLHSDHRREIQELNNQVTYSILFSRNRVPPSACRPQLVSPPNNICSFCVLPRDSAH